MDEDTKTLAKWSIIALIVVLFVCPTGAWAYSWLTVPAKIVSPANVERQWDFAYTHIEALKSIAKNVCAAEQITNDEKDPTIHAQRVSELAAQQQLYQMREAQFDADLRNAFKGGIVAPPDVPRQAPTLTQAKTMYCNK